MKKKQRGKKIILGTNEKHINRWSLCNKSCQVHKQIKFFFALHHFNIPQRTNERTHAQWFEQMKMPNNFAHAQRETIINYYALHFMPLCILLMGKLWNVYMVHCVHCTDTKSDMINNRKRITLVAQTIPNRCCLRLFSPILMKNEILWEKR